MTHTVGAALPTPTPAPPAPKVRRSARVSPQRLIWFLGLLIVPVAWELYAAFADSPLIVGPLAVLEAGVEMARDGELTTAIWQSASVFVVGMAMGTALGLLVGILVGRFRSMDVMLDPYISALFATPLVAVIPILVVALGFGFFAKVVIVAMFAFFPVTINTAAGVRGVPRDLDELARSFCSTELQAWRDILIPGALPFIVTGIRLAVGRSLIAVVVAEFSTAVTGLGFLILVNSRRFNMAESLVPVVILMITGFVLYTALKSVETRLAPWIVRTAE
ncbi:MULTISPECIES: ABC transporter permease [Mycolicibacterium]|jgi:ABC-type nitrate/sulfonate/bicarbonate transport system permease component|uniref:Aliphatic sulfonates ABC transporter, permease protein n=2 Tax=Mycolicibacterium TaxID=1866885 RepID=A0A378TIW6_9MYCO|nr:MULTISPECIES: ABC transporter permease [Mycolicibacterium]MCV7184041.1 ABC transporter permease [Mycolicibacterium murale]BBY84914.1 ABC transporter permease [Mycolicibacterium tokaiense]GFG57487.1 ABC transporter permease [Mycolicibacterium murale]STZ60580.1 aliphatic sulfonates ABC transporter, permease protein [Mycolicibacterium tokaiense]